MKKNNIFWLLMIATALLVMTSLGVSAGTANFEITVNNPTADKYLNTSPVTLSVQANATGQMNTCTFYYMKRGSTTKTNISTNDSGVSFQFFNLSWAIATIDDGLYTFNVTCSNSTSGENQSPANIDFVNDQKSPVMSFNVHGASLGLRGQVLADCSGTTDFSNITYLLTLTKPNGNTVTSSSSSFIFGSANNTDFDAKGIHTLTCKATDSFSRSTTSSDHSISVHGTSQAPITPTGQIITKVGRERGGINTGMIVMFGVLVAVIVVAAIIIGVLTSKGGGRRKGRGKKKSKGSVFDFDF